MMKIRGLNIEFYFLGQKALVCVKVNESIVESESIVKLNDFMLFMIASPGVVIWVTKKW